MSDDKDKRSTDGSGEGTETKTTPSGKTVPLEALHEARAKIAELSKTVGEMQEAEKARKEAIMVEEGKLKELLAEREARISELSKKAEAYDSYTAKAEERVTEKLNSVDEKDRELFASLLEGKHPLEKEALLPSLLERISSTIAKNKPREQSNADKVTLEAEIRKKYAEAKASKSYEALVSVKREARTAGIEL